MRAVETTALVSFAAGQKASDRDTHILCNPSLWASAAGTPKVSRSALTRQRVCHWIQSGAGRTRPLNQQTVTPTVSGTLPFALTVRPAQQLVLSVQLQKRTGRRLMAWLKMATVLMLASSLRDLTLSMLATAVTSWKRTMSTNCSTCSRKKSLSTLMCEQHAMRNQVCHLLFCDGEPAMQAPSTRLVPYGTGYCDGQCAREIILSYLVVLKFDQEK